MSDDRRKTRIDRRRIALSQPWERAYWTKALRVSRERLHEVVLLVGTSAKRVRAYLFHTEAVRALVVEKPKPGAKKRAAKK